MLSKSAVLLKKYEAKDVIVQKSIVIFVVTCCIFLSISVHCTREKRAYKNRQYHREQHVYYESLQPRYLPQTVTVETPLDRQNQEQTCDSQIKQLGCATAIAVVVFVCVLPFLIVTLSGY